MKKFLNFKTLLGATLLVCFSLIVSAAVMDLATFQAHANRDKSRCVDQPTSIAYGQGELQYALDQGLIGPDVYQWGMTNKYFPVVDRHNNIRAVCTMGCFHANSKLLLVKPEDNEASWIKASKMTESHLAVSLSPESTLGNIELVQTDILKVLSGPELAALYHFKLSNGKTLKLTQHHGVVLSDGRVIAAKDVKVSDKLISAKDGSEISIKKICRKETKLDVYNLVVKGDESISHIVVSEGVLVGDNNWQNKYVNELGSIIIRK